MTDFLAPEFLSQFTCKDMCRVELTTPWSKDGFTYATNGVLA